MSLKENIQKKKIQMRRQKNNGLHLMKRRHRNQKLGNFSHIPSYPPCVQKNNKKKEEDFNVMV